MPASGATWPGLQLVQVSLAPVEKVLAWHCTWPVAPSLVLALYPASTVEQYAAPPSENSPLGQGEQVKASNSAKLPAGHSWQSVSTTIDPGSQAWQLAKSEADRFPDGQEEQGLVAPRENLPLSQGWHVLLVMFAYAPAPQKVQTLCPSFGLTNPLVALQLEQLEDAIPLNLPFSQSVQEEASLKLNVPG